MSLRVLAAAAALLTVACGGSKKPAAPGAPTVSYTGPVTAASFSAASTDKAAIAGAGWAAGGMLGGMSGMSVAMPTGAVQPSAPMGVKDVLAAAAAAFHRPEVAAAAGALTASTRPCTGGGSQTISVSQQSADPTITTAGDYVEVSLAGCTEGDQGGTIVMNGSFRLTIDQTTGDEFVTTPSSITDTAFGLTIAFNNLVTILPQDGVWSGVDGDIGVSLVASVAAGTITYGISGTEFVQAVGMGNQVMAGFRLAPLAGQPKYHDTAVETYTALGTASATHVSASWDLDARLCTTEMGGCANIETNPVFVVTDPNLYPDAGGALTVSDDAGHWVKATAMNASTGACRITWSFDGSVLDTYWDNL